MADLLRHLDLNPEYVAVELNRAPWVGVGTRKPRLSTAMSWKWSLLWVAGPPVIEEPELLTIGTHTFRSRLFVGTGKYRTLELMRDCLDASGAEVVTVAAPANGCSIRKAAISSIISTPSVTRSCPTRPVASLPRTPSAPLDSVASCWKGSITPGPTG